MFPYSISIVGMDIFIRSDGHFCVVYTEECRRAYCEVVKGMEWTIDAGDYGMSFNFLFRFEVDVL
jgi:hypothetical protein